MEIRFYVKCNNLLHDTNFCYKKQQTQCNKGISPNGNVSGDVVFHVRHGA